MILLLTVIVLCGILFTNLSNWCFVVKLVERLSIFKIDVILIFEYVAGFSALLKTCSSRINQSYENMETQLESNSHVHVYHLFVKLNFAILSLKIEWDGLIFEYKTCIL